MDPTLTRQIPQVVALCKQFGVARLSLFGSAALDAPLTAQSDYDFLVELDAETPGSRAQRWIGLAEALEGLLGRHVDLVNPRYVRNPFFQKAIESSRMPLYEQQSAQTAA